LFLQQPIQFSVVSWCQLRNENPNQQITPWHVEVLEEVVLNPSPADNDVSLIQFM
jgi:hypothetical protein